MQKTWRAAVTLAAALAVSAPALGTEKEASDKVVSNQVEADAQTQTEAKTPGPADANVAPQGEAAPAPIVLDPFAAALKDKLGATARNLGARDKAERAALEEFYATRDYQPVWANASGLSDKAKSVIAEIEAADDWGLTSSDFVLPSLAMPSGHDEMADAEIKLGLAALKYARFARGGRLEPTALTKFLDRTPPLIEPKSILAQLAEAASPGEYLRGLHPQHPQFERLRQKYLAMRHTPQAMASAAKVPNGPKLEPGARHAHIALVRQRLGVPLAADVDEKLYDDALARAVKEFQAARGMKRPDGTINSTTRQALNTIESGSARRILSNMEQWRWMPADLGRFHVWVNIPEFMIRLVQDGRVALAERIVVGKTDSQTPIFSDQLEQVIFHPFWGVPDSIKRNELQPNLAAGGSILARQGLRVQYRGREVDPEAVDWGAMDMRNVHIYQPPGPANVLGVVKFRFPNKHDVYFHDTPQKHLFQASVRTFSHGCMRVQNPVRLAELILAHDKNMSSDRVRGLASPGSPQDNQINLTSKLPVHITYFTASVDEHGQVTYRSDIYGHEERISLGLEGKTHLISKVREPAPARREYGASYASRPGQTPAWIRGLFNW
jgi:murein L,D-transpeptidase YcbB/YkuD